MDQLSPRQSEILERARRVGRVDVEGLSVHFDLTPQTIRRDLNELCDGGYLNRFHGGAVYPAGVQNVAYQSRRQLAADEKRRIGERAAQLIPDNSSIILNIGTTTEQVAHALKGHDGLMVITNNLNAANDLREAGSVEVVIAGGMVRQSDGGIIGDATVDFIRQFKVDYAVVGASAIDIDGTILDFDFREVRVAQEIIRHARRTILVSDSMKFERSAPIRIANLADIDVFVTDTTPPDAIVEICRYGDTRIEIAASQTSEAGLQ